MTLKYENTLVRLWNTTNSRQSDQKRNLSVKLTVKSWRPPMTTSTTTPTLAMKRTKEPMQLSAPTRRMLESSVAMARAPPVIRLQP